MKKKRTYKPYHYLIIIFLGGLSVVILYPLVWMLMTSFKTNVDIRTNRAKFFPTEWTLEGYRTAFEKAPIANWFINSILITVIITLAVIVTSTLMGYVFAKYEFRFKRTLFVLLLATMMVPPQVTMIPRYLMIQKLHLFDTRGALIVPALVSAFSVYLAKQFIADIPDSLCEAAKIDGAGDFRIYIQIIMPNVKPAWLTLALFSFQSLWNSTSSTYIFSEELKTLPYALNQIASGGIARAGAAAAGVVVMMVVPIIFFIVSQSSIMETMASSGLKE